MNPRIHIGFVGLLLAALPVAVAAQVKPPALDPGIQSLAAEFFAWRAATQPCTPDDIPRIERPHGWLPDFSPEGLARRKEEYAAFRSRLNALPRTGWSRGDSVDWLLLRSAVERVHWELGILRLPERNPDFYLQQTLGSVFELLVLSSPMTDAKMDEIVSRIRAIPVTLSHARANLSEPILPFAAMAIDNLRDIRGKLERLAEELKRVSSAKHHAAVGRAVPAAAEALEEFSRWLQSRLPGMKPAFSPGREACQFFLKNVALIPMTAEEMVSLGRLELDRATACEAMEKQRNAETPELPFFRSLEEQVRQTERDEAGIRAFLESRDLLTVPASIRHYTVRPIPPVVAALASIGEEDDLTSSSRLTEDGVRYVRPPSLDLPFFPRTLAQDPRPIIIHEGVPGHYFQLALSWGHEDPIRRRYFDSGSNEGWGFYVEEMLLQAGLFDRDRPRSRGVIYRFMKLRALRVEVDVRLATGEMTMDRAAEYLTSTVPMERSSAMEEATFFASTPGQGISYQIGKLQIQHFLRDAWLQQGEAFRLRAFHDYLVRNGNVPIALLRWEYLGLRDEIDKLW